MSPAEELAAAAAKVRTLANAVSAPDPKYQPFHADGCDISQGPHGLYDVGTTVTPELATYIAAMHPGVGLALADWLEAAAAEVARVEERYRDRTAGESMAPNALAVARAINGSST